MAPKSAPKQQAESDLLEKQQQEAEAEVELEDKVDDVPDSDSEAEDSDVTSDEPEVQENEPVKEKSSKPRRAFVDPQEIKELILLDTKGALTKAGKLLDRLSRQLEKIQAKKRASGPRKLSAYNVYTRQHMVDVQQLESKLRMKELGQRWKKLSEKEKAKYQKLAAEANEA